MEFEEGKDYKSLHLQWLSEHKSFKPKGWVSTPEHKTYYDQMYALYNCPHGIKQQYTAYRFFQGDYKWLNSKSDINTVAAEMFGKSTNYSEWFVTLGFNHQTFDVLKCHNLILKLFDKEFVDDAYGVFEFYTKSGEHPHFHFYLKSTDAKTKGRVLDRIYQSAGIKKFVLGKNNIDVKIWESRYNDYINGNKTDGKMEYVQQDKLWRQQNNLPDLVKKNN